ncbi:MBL fold metallo-hydrolase [Paenibacillus sp.]|uniref:MBL fold metallo-hydrolase n=1 Tax=Paenibacillus sp. TaxID=58172 RepID=UPI002D548EEA|nr:MBL fold metallo-hydrolase [Paenibacillus sp.]HZG84578.1 MBL fold metallo-hydrolase [Paenibacillus sp.]
MKIERYGNVYQVTFMPRMFPVNCYLVEEEDSLTLIDAALPYSAGAILDAAAAIGKSIANIALTHAHEDHIGALAELKRRLPEAIVAVSERDARLLAGDRSLLPGEPQTPIRGGVPKKRQPAPDRLLREGDRIGSLEAVAAPGHTPGSMAFLDARSGALIAGDAFQTRGGTAVSGTPVPWFPFPAWATWHADTALESARKLAALEPSLLAVGHGPALREPLGAMNDAIAEAEARLRDKR